MVKCVVCDEERAFQRELCNKHAIAHDERAELIDNEDLSFELEKMLLNAYINRDIHQSYVRDSLNHKLALLLEDKGLFRAGKIKIPSPYHIRFKLSRLGKQIGELCYLESLLDEKPKLEKVE